VNLTLQEISREVTSTGFGEPLEKVFRLMALLDALNAHPFLKTCVALKGDLMPMLRSDVAPARGEVAAWFDKLVAECRERLGIVLPLRAHELEFLERLNGAGDVAPEVLSDDAVMQAIIRDHPGLKWKALNVRKRLGVAAGDGEAVESS
jgi:hypothetical protein